MKYHVDRHHLEREVRIDTFRAGGHGGQNLHKTESAVRLTHLPSGVSVIASDTRSQTRNRDIAFERLAERLRRLNHRDKPRKSTKVPRAEKERRMEAKKHRGRSKQMRRSNRYSRDDV